MTLELCLPDARYPVVIEPGLLARAGTLLDLRRRVLVVTDEGVPSRYAEALAAQCADPLVIRLPGGEACKTLETLTRLLTSMLRRGYTRQDCVVALGGGLVGDLAGFAAACYMRGIDFYNIPTTLLAMADAAVGGKTAVNLDGVKNAVGAFWQPKAVLMDPQVLAALPEAHIANGMAEIVKMALTLDPPLFDLLERQGREALSTDPAALIAAAVRLKKTVVEADERESGQRRVLNFGHTLGHGIESAAAGTLLHGQCVALGMLPMCAPEVRARLGPVLAGLGLPTSACFDPETALAAILHDKKSTPGGVAAVTVSAPGCWQIRKMSPDLLRAKLEEVRNCD